MSRFASTGRFAVAVGLCLALAASAGAQGWPKAANQYRKLWTSEFRKAGLHPRYETWLLGQITQESRWDPNAVSPVGATGLAQFMGATQRLMERAYGDDLRGLGGPREPQWAIRAYLLLMKENVLAFRRAPDRLTRYYFGAAAYNGGPGYLRRERDAAGGSWDWETVRAFCREFRSDASCVENVEYPDHALRFAPRFRGF